MRGSLIGAAVGLATVPVLGMSVVMAAALGEPSAAGGQAVGAAGDIPPSTSSCTRRRRLGCDSAPTAGRTSPASARSSAITDARRRTAATAVRRTAPALAGRRSSSLPTWEAYGVDGDGDGRRDVYVPVDAIFGMANYLARVGRAGRLASGALRVQPQRGVRRRRHRVEGPLPARPRPRSPLTTQPVGAGWLQPLPSVPGDRCDSRIVADVEAIVRVYGVTISDCYGGAPHTVNGEHPLGLAMDSSRPTATGRGRCGSPSTSAGRPIAPPPAAAAAGRSAVVLYNGYPGHGDPAHTDTPHLHLSWQHTPAAPFTRAEVGQNFGARD